MSGRKTTWLLVAGVIGLTYTVIGVVVAWPAAHPHIWRLAAWALSGVIFGTHISYERFRLRNSHARVGLHVALGAAIGAFGVAVSANLNAMHLASPERHRMFLMLSVALWPLMVAVPSFCVAVPTSWILSGLARLRNRTSAN